jgi:hypothetical protein
MPTPPASCGNVASFVVGTVGAIRTGYRQMRSLSEDLIGSEIRRFALRRIVSVSAAYGGPGVFGVPSSMKLFRLRMLSPQSARYSCSQAFTVCNGLAFSPQMLAVPSLWLTTRPAARSRRRCLEIAGRLERKLEAILPTVRGPSRSSRRISRRVGSAIARKRASSFLRLIVTIWLRKS